MDRQRCSKGHQAGGTGTVDLPFLKRAADVPKGKMVYVSKCQTCHGKKRRRNYVCRRSKFRVSTTWGPESYNIGAGLYRLGRFAGYVKYSMPLGATFEKPQLTDEEAWDVAAFVNSQPRPVKFFSKDWPDTKKKAMDYPYGPYADRFLKRSISTSLRPHQSIQGLAGKQKRKCRQMISHCLH